ncbi:MAG: hypothetical protein HW416_277 [Chloroflexi bacterium]|nr:hypothetical protein [Chloroflexota bacterium]
MGLVVLLLVAGCTRPSPEPSAGAAVDSRPSTAKILTVGVQRELGSFGEFGVGGGGTIAPELAHNALVVKNQDGIYVPQLAAEQISVERGTWRLNADGSMDTTWKLRPGLLWHDRTPFTSADLLFTFTAYKDPTLPSGVASQMLRMESASAPNPLTFAVHWSSVDVKADQAAGLTPLPRHLLETSYQSDRASIATSSRLTTEFVGLGPYRLARWDAGVQMELVRFDAYHAGRPALDKIILRYIADPNALVASLLAGGIDLVLPPGVDVDLAMDVEQRWKGTDNRVVMRTAEDLNAAYALQFREEYSRPHNGLTNRDVREALYRAIDRAAMADAMTHGLAAVADSWVSPLHPLRPDVAGAIPQFPFDPARAQQLMEGAGWVLGADGMVVARQSGERLEIEISGPQRAVVQKQQPIIGDAWRNLGVDPQIHVIPPSLDTDRKYEATRPGIILGSIGDYRLYFDNHLHSRETSSDDNRWGGRNKGGYRNPSVDAILDRLSTTIDPRPRVALNREYLQVAMGDVALMPFYWEVYPALIVASVRGPIYPAKSGGAWNAFEWDKRAIPPALPASFRRRSSNWARW